MTYAGWMFLAGWFSGAAFTALVIHLDERRSRR